MADRVYAGTPADFAIALGAELPLLDESGDPIGDDVGWDVLIPKVATAFDVYDVEANAYTDLVVGGVSASTVTPSIAWDTAGQIMLFTVNDAPEGDVYLVSTGGTPFEDPTFRLSPATDEIFDRLAALESLETTGLADWSPTPPTDGQVPVFDTDTGLWTPGNAGAGDVSTVAGVSPTSGDIPGVTLKAALNAADATTLSAFITLVQQRTYVLCKPSGGAYEAKPVGWTNAIRPGEVQPVSQLAEFDIWLQPASEE
jgi:hypothetical protein